MLLVKPSIPIHCLKLSLQTLSMVRKELVYGLFIYLFIYFVTEYLIQDQS